MERGSRAGQFSALGVQGLTSWGRFSAARDSASSRRLSHIQPSKLGDSSHASSSKATGTIARVLPPDPTTSQHGCPCGQSEVEGRRPAHRQPQFPLPPQLPLGASAQLPICPAAVGGISETRGHDGITGGPALLPTPLLCWEHLGVGGSPASGAYNGGWAGAGPSRMQ